MDMTFSQIRLVLEASRRKEARQHFGQLQAVFAAGCGLFGKKGGPVFTRAMSSLQRVANGEASESTTDQNAKFLNVLDKVERHLKPDVQPPKN